MLKDILNYLFKSSLSKVDSVIITMTMVLFINKKYKYGLCLMLIGGLITAMIETLLNKR